MPSDCWPQGDPSEIGKLGTWELAILQACENANYSARLMVGLHEALIHGAVFPQESEFETSTAFPDSRLRATASVNSI